MQNIRIGVNFPKGVRAERLEETIHQMADFGYDIAEYNLSDLPLIIGGTVCRQYVSFAAGIFRRSPIPFTAHIGTGMDLRKRESFALAKNVLRSSIEVCSELGMPLLTLHFEEASRHEDIEQAFFDAHLEAAEYAAKLGVRLCIENIETERYEYVVAMVKKANHPNFNMTLDLGHLNLSTRFYGQSFEEAVRACAPLARHLHISDNTGRFENMRLENFDLYRTLPMGYRIAFGCGDIHIPPFWGEIDLPLALNMLHEAGYGGIFLCEYYSELFNPFNKSIQENVREKVTGIFGR